MDKTKGQREDNLELKGIEFDILMVLLLGEFYGLDLLEQINQDRPRPLNFSSLYMALNRLNRKGFIEWRWGDVTDGTNGARRKYYKATGLGERAVKSWVSYYSKQLRLKPCFE